VAGGGCFVAVRVRRSVPPVAARCLPDSDHRRSRQPHRLGTVEVLVTCDPGRHL